MNALPQLEAHALRTHFVTSCLGAGLLALGACGEPESEHMAVTTPEAGEATISVALSIRERVALSDEAVAEAELIAGNDDGYIIIAQVREELGGRQVPTELTITYDPADVPGRGEAAVTGRIIDPASGHVWVMEQGAPVSAASQSADLGMIMLERSGHGTGGPRSYLCGDGSVLTVTYTGGGLDVEWQGATHSLSPVVAASGARFETGDREGDDWLMFWSRGQAAMLGLPGQDPLSCEVEPLPEPETDINPAAEAPVYTASGNEPGWLLRLTGDAAEYLGNYGNVRIVGPVTRREALEEGVSRLTVEAADGIVLVAEIGEARCQDTMTGVTYPDTVTVVLGEARYAGCGGDAESLLTGGAWIVTHIAGEAVPGPRAVTLEFDGEGRVAGQAPCNRYSASYQMTGEGLVISQALSTRMACVAEIMALEDTFLETFQGSLTASIDAEGVLSLGEGRILAVRE